MFKLISTKTFKGKAIGKGKNTIPNLGICMRKSTIPLMLYFWCDTSYGFPNKIMLSKVYKKNQGFACFQTTASPESKSAIKPPNKYAV